MDPRSVIKRAITTEKTSELKQKNNRYVFEVDIKANKVDIKNAVETMFKVKTIKINTSITHGKKKRVRWQLGNKPDWKKAMVQLRVGDRIEMLE
ncbi:50S ribosomal protein L23 [Candidatus Desantisbacteria bacterium CG_4_10_14_0_8_um_filter_48_22]|uniref:Large ribosomal subunit protein uL23 n=1 Tax=Candidatus Desantisbacteria bacterium CG_4_10_14_0_8_um_filter_48_22 TaxID=1974543 RepID=A0A2M7S9L8_9BACT|nr:MAG: 50S ribosomal protein L23 [Candidatus Desantisbacteria bacterium CG_4_10_14_0_8_um_filter_48_22]